MIQKLDPSVVERIAAGEVIHHPCNAVKELIENSLDAGATNINIVLVNGGLELIKVTDNGHGVKMEDMPLMCERYATSKLKEYRDLTKLRTLGFRGEALASISQVSKVTIVTKHVDSNLGYQAIYQNGNMISKPKIHASNNGTIISIQNLFDNIPMRKKALKSGNEEYQRVLDCVKKYSIHNTNVSFTLKKESSIGILCLKASNQLERISQIYGKNISSCLKLAQHQNNKYSFIMLSNDMESNTSNNSKGKYEFILFVNNRLVENVAIKKELKQVYSEISAGPSTKPSFIYLALNVNPENVDINIHPTKNEIRLLDEDSIIENIVTVLKKALESIPKLKKKSFPAAIPLLEKETLNYYFKPVNDRRGSSASTISTSSSVNTPPSTSPIIPEKNELEDYFEKMYDNNSSFNTTPPRQNIYAQTKKAPLLAISTQEQGHKPASSINNNANPKKRQSVHLEKIRKINELDIQNTTQEKEKLDQEENPQELNSIITIKNEINQSEDKRVSKLISNHQKIGTIDDVLYIAVYKDRYYLMNYNVISEEYFYQAIINLIGKFGSLLFSSPLSIQSCLALALPSASKDNLKASSHSLLSHRDLLKSYYGLGIDLSKDDDETVYLTCLPMILANYVPRLNRMPIFLCNLVNHIDWENEIDCLDGLAREIASLYYCCSKDQWEYVIKTISFEDFKAPKILCENGYVVELDFPNVVMKK